MSRSRSHLPMSGQCGSRTQHDLLVALAAANFSALAARALANAALRLASTSGSVIGFRVRRGLASGGARAAGPGHVPAVRPSGCRARSRSP